MEEIATKKCKDCGRDLPLSAFGKHAKAKDGLQSICRECASKRMKGNTRSARAAKESEDPHGGLGDYNDTDLFAELRYRGWKGQLTRTMQVEI